MTATVVDMTPCAPEALAKLIESAVRNLEDNIVTGDGGKGAGIPFSYGDEATLATTSLDEAADTVRLCLFPPGSYINDFRGTITDVDTNATPTIVYDVVTLTSANVVVDVLVNDSTNGQGGGTDRIANAAVYKFVGDLYLGLKIVTGAATAAAGTYNWGCTFTPGLLSLHADNASVPDPAMTDLDI